MKNALLTAMLFSSTLAQAQGRHLPSDRDLRAAYCSELHNQGILYLQETPGSFPKDMIPAAIELSRKPLAHLNAYLLPRLPYLDQNAIEAAKIRAIVDNREAQEEIAKSKGNTAASPAYERIKKAQCFELDWLPF